MQLQIYNLIQKRVEMFIRRYYLNKLFRGSIFFMFISLTYLAVAVFLENRLWLSELGRAILFFSLLGVLLFCFIKYILIPVFQYFNIIRDLDLEKASNIIGRQIHEIDDKLLNIIQLYKNKSEDEELLLASVEQKCKEVYPFKFNKAISIKDTLLASKYLLIPIVLILFIRLSDTFQSYGNSLLRISDYKKEYVRPATFDIEILNDSLQVTQYKSFLLKIQLQGKDIPTQAVVLLDDNPYLMNKLTDEGQFEYTFKDVAHEVPFRIKAGSFTSLKYTLAVKKVPVIHEMKLIAQYPAYTNKKPDTIANLFDISVPRGTFVEWQAKTSEADEIEFTFNGLSIKERLETNELSKKHRILEDTKVTVTVSNRDFKKYEVLNYNIRAIEDLPPSINVIQKVDSTFIDKHHIYGVIFDDYGLSKLNLVYYKTSDPQKVFTRTIPIDKSLKQDFYYTFPTLLNLEEGQEYVYYFQVYDNDIFPKNKSARSQEFRYNSQTKEAIRKIYLEKEASSLEKIDSILADFDGNKSKEFFIKNQIDYNSSKFEDFLKRELLQQQMMEKFTKDLIKQQEQIGGQESKDLQQRLDSELDKEQLRKKMLEDIKKLVQQNREQEIDRKMQQLKRETKTAKRNLNQILEITKRNFLNKKLEFIAQKAEKLSKDISQNKTIDSKQQQAYQQKFKDIQKELDEAEAFNRTLNREINIARDQALEKSITKDLQDGQKYIDQEDPATAKDVNEKASEKIQRMADNIKTKNEQGKQMQMKMDIAAFRQIMDNLLDFSFSQEALTETAMQQRETKDVNGFLIKQNDLKQLFQHIDDSIYNLSLSQPMITGKINEQIEQVHYFMENALNDFSERMIPQAVLNQRYALTNVNELASFVSDALDNITLQMSKGGDGESQESDQNQLEDIIEKQKELLDKTEQEIREQQEQRKETDPSDQMEESSKKRMELYKEQEKINQMLSDLMRKTQSLEEKKQGKGLGNDMEKTQKNILNEGLTTNTRSQIERIYKKLLEFKNANYTQNKKNDQRESQTATRQFENNAGSAQEYFKNLKKIEDLLLREPLPVKEEYQSVINKYFHEKSSL